jgi:alkylated DNA repair protein (DNA oxidative demethylase)
MTRRPEPGVSADLFDSHDPNRIERLGPGTALLQGYALGAVPTLLDGLRRIVERAPFRQMQVPGGRTMSVVMSNCGSLGWVSDGSGYRYAAIDPHSGEPLPALPEAFSELAQRAALQAGFPGFVADACLINRYTAGARLSLHQDRNERDFTAPVVSVSLGLPAVFLLGGSRRADKAQRLLLRHGDTLVWGAADRLRYHGVLPLAAGCHAVLGEQRINLTFAGPPERTACAIRPAGKTPTIRAAASIGMRLACRRATISYRGPHHEQNQAHRSAGQAARRRRPADHHHAARRQERGRAARRSRGDRSEEAGSPRMAHRFFRRDRRRQGGGRHRAGDPQGRGRHPGAADAAQCLRGRQPDPDRRNGGGGDVHRGLRGALRRTDRL